MDASIYKALLSMIPGAQAAQSAGSIYQALTPQAGQDWHTIMNAPNPNYNIPAQREPQGGPQQVSVYGSGK